MDHLVPVNNVGGFLFSMLVTVYLRLFILQHGSTVSRKLLVKGLLNLILKFVGCLTNEPKKLLLCLFDLTVLQCTSLSSVLLIHLSHLKR